MNNKQKILIADDSEMNRSILADILEDKYDIIETEDGVEGVAAIQKYGTEISVVLLDVVMPRMDGFGVLDLMNQHHWIDEIPVIMISSESAQTFVERAYDMGVNDFISRPFDALIVRRRVINTILLYAKQKKLTDLLVTQLMEKEERSNLMVDILSHIVEFRNGESGLHVIHVRMLTELLLNHLFNKTDRYNNLSREEMAMISMASALHDIGKISIDESILNKPGRLTDEEFEIMKTHSMIGAKMLSEATPYKDDKLVQTAYEICRWHHERYDGSGYPDGLKGDEIPISAQIVSMADVYDALTSERVYKKALPHETAIQMIVDGKCGAFNPLLLECLQEVANTIRDTLAKDVVALDRKRAKQNVAAEMLRNNQISASERTLRLLEKEREKYKFFAALTKEIQFEYNIDPPTLTLNPWGTQKLGLDEIIMEPHQNPQFMAIMGEETWCAVKQMLLNTTPEKPAITYDCKLQYNGELRWHRVIARAIWQEEEEEPIFQGAIGKVLDIHDSKQRLADLERKANHDSLTGLLNHASARKQIIEQLEGHPHEKYALIIFDLDHFKNANDTYGHIFGDEVLKLEAQKLKDSLRTGDIAARIGGDEFLIFLKYADEVEPIIERIFNILIGKYEDFEFTVSMGVVQTEFFDNDYETLFHAADTALYTAKRGGRGKYRIYTSDMADTLSNTDASAITEIESNDPEHQKLLNE